MFPIFSGHSFDVVTQHKLQKFHLYTSSEFICLKAPRGGNEAFVVSFDTVVLSYCFTSVVDTLFVVHFRPFFGVLRDVSVVLRQFSISERAGFGVVLVCNK